MESRDRTHLDAAAPTPPRLRGPSAGGSSGHVVYPRQCLCSGSSVTGVLGPPLPETGKPQGPKKLQPAPRRRPGPCRGPDPRRQGPSGSRRRSTWLTPPPPRPRRPGCGPARVAAGAGAGAASSTADPPEQVPGAAAPAAARAERPPAGESSPAARAPKGLAAVRWARPVHARCRSPEDEGPGSQTRRPFLFLQMYPALKSFDSGRPDFNNGTSG